MIITMDEGGGVIAMEASAGVLVRLRLPSNKCRSSGFYQTSVTGYTETAQSSSRYKRQGMKKRKKNTEKSF